MICIRLVPYHVTNQQYVSDHHIYFSFTYLVISLSMVIRATEANGLSFPDFLESSLQIFRRRYIGPKWKLSRHRTQTPIRRGHNLGPSEIRTEEPRFCTAEDSTRLLPSAYFTIGLNFMFTYNHGFSRPAMGPTQPPIQWVAGVSGG